MIVLIGMVATGCATTRQLNALEKPIRLQSNAEKVALKDYLNKGDKSRYSELKRVRCYACQCYGNQCPKEERFTTEEACFNDLKNRAHQSGASLVYWIPNHAEARETEKLAREAGELSSCTVIEGMLMRKRS